MLLSLIDIRHWADLLRRLCYPRTAKRLATVIAQKLQSCFRSLTIDYHTLRIEIPEITIERSRRVSSFATPLEEPRWLRSLRVAVPEVSRDDNEPISPASHVA